MWLKDLTQLPGLIRDLIALQREANALARELIQATTGTRAQTLRPRLETDQPRPRLTASTVTRHGREDWAAIQEKDRARVSAPWRGAVDLTPSTRPSAGDPPNPGSLAPPPDPAGAP